MLELVKLLVFVVLYSSTQGDDRLFPTKKWFILFISVIRQVSSSYNRMFQ